MVEVKEIMRKKVVTLDHKVSVYEATKVMSSNKIGAIILVENGKPFGIVTREDVVDLVASNKDPKKVTLGQAGCKKLVTAKPTDDMLDVVKLMNKYNYKRIPIVDKGKLIGIVSDKEILITAPELIELLSERLKIDVKDVNASIYRELKSDTEDELEKEEVEEREEMD